VTTDDETPDERPDELEWRLHAMFSGRADAVESQLSGPRLRARARQRWSAVRRAVPPLAAAAAVAAIAIGIAVAGSDGGDTHHPGPAGGPTIGSTTGSTSPSRPSSVVVRRSGTTAVPRPSSSGSSPALSPPASSIPTRGRPTHSAPGAEPSRSQVTGSRTTSPTSPRSLGRSSPATRRS